MQRIAICQPAGIMTGFSVENGLKSTPGLHLKKTKYLPGNMPGFFFEIHSFLIKIIFEILRTFC